MRQILHSLLLVSISCTALRAQNPTDTIALKTEFPDSTFRAQMLRKADTNKDKQLQYSEAWAVKSISSVTSGYLGKSYTGIGLFKNLDSLYVEYPAGPSIDLSKNEKMTFLDLHWSKGLTSVTISHKAPFVFIRVSDNGLTSFDASGLTKLKSLLVGAQKLTSLNIQGTSLDYLNAFENPEVSICVDSEEQWQAIAQNDIRTCAINYPNASYCKYKLVCGVVTSLETEQTLSNSGRYKTFDLWGVQVSGNTKGALIRVYENGTREKLFQTENK